MKESGRIIFFFINLFLLLQGLRVGAQDPTARFRNLTHGSGGGRPGAGTDSLAHRVDDTITIHFRYLDSSRLQKLDSSVFDFTKKIPLPATYVDLGNMGTPSHDLVFHPFLQPGWDGGWHGLDPYTFNAGQTQFFSTTKPYTELGYLIGSQAEQLVNLVHTQNITPNLNALFQYRLITAPGYIGNQNSNHNNYKFSMWYQSKNKRYQAFLILLGSKLQVSENGGLKNNSDLDSLAYASNRFNIPTRLGAHKIPTYSPFSSLITTGTFYTTATYMFRQQYDIIGKKDSIVTDSTVTPLFYPRFRAEYNITYNTYHYRFVDDDPDTTTYINYYHFISTPDTLRLGDTWKQLTNDFSLYQFPDARNPQQFIKAGISFQSMNGQFDAGTRSLYNVFAHGEYRNKTRNKKWDVEALGNFYLSGFNSGDYNAYISLGRLISKNLGFLQVGFQDVNRTVSSAWEQQSSFGFGVPGFFNKENVINIFGSLDLPKYNLKLSGSYYLLNNYPYFHDYYKAAQESNPFNVLVISAEKIFVLHKNWIWRANLVLQQRAGSGPVNIPGVVSTNQIGYEGKLGFKNLNIAFGVEIRYYTPYKADGYAAVIGQYFTQSDATIKQKLPDINGYLHFRIRSFTAYIRAENLNTLQLNGPNGFGFTNNNFVAPYYPYPGLRLRLGIFWGFVN